MKYTISIFSLVLLSGLNTWAQAEPCTVKITLSPFSGEKSIVMDQKYASALSNIRCSLVSSDDAKYLIDMSSNPVTFDNFLLGSEHYAIATVEENGVVFRDDRDYVYARFDKGDSSFRARMGGPFGRSDRSICKGGLNAYFPEMLQAIVSKEKSEEE